MLDRKFIRKNPDAVQRAAELKGIELDVEELIRLDSDVRSLQTETDDLQRLRRSLSDRFRKADESARAALRSESAEIDERLTKTRDALSLSKERLRELLLKTPTIPWEGAPIGAGESENTQVKVWGEQPEFTFETLDHVDLAEERGWAQFTRARTVSGERAYALTGDGLMLERALLSYALDVMRRQDFTVVGAPALVRESALVGSGFFPSGREEVYALAEDDLFLAGTAEVGLVGLHMDEILSHKDLPIKYAGISPCFRREIGSASRDVRGLLRVHQFEKVEQFVICEADPQESEKWHAHLLGTAERILQELGFHYEVVECSTGDMGLGKFRMNDINTWFPSLGRFRETHSCSTLHDWQARRANIRYKDASGKIRHPHTLNNTAVATPRLVAAFLENFQTADRRVRIPEVLQPYLDGRDML